MTKNIDYIAIASTDANLEQAMIDLKMTEITESMNSLGNEYIRIYENAYNVSNDYPSLLTPQERRVSLLSNDQIAREAILILNKQSDLPRKERDIIMSMARRRALI